MDWETTSSAFEQALADFREGLKRDGLKRRDDELLSQVTRDSFLTHLEDVQNEQHSKRRGRNLARLQPMIEATDQLGKVIKVFVNAEIFVAYIWGPIKFILQIAGAYSGAFNDLLDMYEKIGDSFRLLTQSEQLFRTDSQVLRLLILMYKDIFEFHRQAIKYFRQPLLKQLFDATWKTYKSRFDPIVNRIRDHGDMIHRKATLSHIRQFQQARADRDAERQLREENEQNQRLRVLYDWLHSPNVENDQYHYSTIRQEYPGTGRWLLDVPVFKEWFDPKFHSIPALLWITGMPGSGKTILASLVVEAARALPSPPTVLFFYCKDGDKERDNFESIGRTFLVHLLNGNKDILLPYYYEYFSTSTETTLRTHSIIEDLLRTGIMNCPDVYIVLDGIDKCDRQERRRITEFFRGLVENSSTSQPDRVRCLFISQQDGFARKDFSDMTTFKIESKHNGGDIETFCKASAKAMSERFELDDTERVLIAMRVSARAKGIFLLAKLICGNLINQPSREDLDLELEDDNLPQDLVEAYKRITTRILVKAPQRERKAPQKLLTWLVCAKRPLKWHEIQAAKSIHLEIQTVDFEQYRFRVAAKDLCGSLVEDGPDGTVELVHSTAKSFLLSEKHVKQRLGELRMATLCLSYWNMPGLSGLESYEQLKARVPSGYFAFLDYSISNWIHHFLEGLKDDTTKQEEVLQDLSECLGTFLELHLRRSKTTKNFQISQSTIQRLQPFEEAGFYSDLQKVVTAARNQLKFDGEMQSSEVLLDLVDIALNIRDILEDSYGLEYEDERRAEFEKMYGKRIFKCTKLSCHAFCNGFATAAERKLHLDKHDRPFRCTMPGCPQEYIGFSTNDDLERHTARTHATQCEEEGVFPDESEIFASRIPPKNDQDATPGPIQIRAPQEQEHTFQETQLQAGRKRKYTEFQCQSCSKVFRRKYNLQSHMVTHDSGTKRNRQRHTWKTHGVQPIEKARTSSGAVSNPTTSRPPEEIVQAAVASKQDSNFTHQDSVLIKEEDSLTSISAITSAKRDFNDSTAELLENLSKSQRDEIESIVSDELDTGSVASSSRTHTEMHAISRIAICLTRIDELIILCTSALQAMSQERFSKDFRRILKYYYNELKKESCNRKEEIIAHLFRKRTDRTGIAQKIIQIVQDDRDQTRDVERPKQSSNPNEEVSTWLVESDDHEFFNNSGRIGKMLGGDKGGDIENSDYESDDSESSSPSNASDITSTENEFHDIESLEGFLRRGQPFQKLLIDLRILRLSGPLREIVNTVPKQLIYLSEKNESSFFNRGQIWLERYTSCHWDWWPLKPPLQTITGENLRLRWTLYGRCLQMEVPRGQADLLSQILDRADDHPRQCHCCFPKPLVTWSTVLSRAKRMINLGHQNANDRPDQSVSGVPSEAAQRYTPYELTPIATSSTSRPAHIIQTASSFAEGAGENTNAPRFLKRADYELPECVKSLNVIFAVQGWRVSLELKEIVVADRPTDSKFFQKLREFHRSHRPRLSNLFSPYRFGNCKFVKFEKMQPTIIRSSSEPALPDYYGYHAEYEYEPRPPGAKLPLIDQQQFWILLNECNRECLWSISPWHDCIRLSPRSSFLRKIPKRNNPSSLLLDDPNTESNTKSNTESNNASNDVAFGIEADYILSLRYLAFYHIVPIFLAFSFWTYWLVMHPGDLQNASVPIFTVLALASTFWVLVGKRAGIS